MGNDIVQHRAAIGLFNCRVNKQQSLQIVTDGFRDIFLTNIRCTFAYSFLALFQCLNPRVNIIFVLMVIQMLLIIGNVERNPGPESILNQTVQSFGTNFISICNMNIRSIRNKLNFFETFTEEFDVVAVTESHLSPEITNDDLLRDSFFGQVIRKDRNNLGGGVLIFMKNDISAIRN